MIDNLQNKQTDQNITKNLFVVILLVSFFFGIISAGWIALGVIEQQTRTNMKESLQTVLRTTQESMYIWFENRSYRLEAEAKTHKLIKLTKAQLAIPHDYDSLVKSTVLHEIRLFFEPKLEKHGDLGIFIIAPDLTSIASMRDMNIGSMNIIAKERPNLLQKVLKGEIHLIPTIRSDVPLPDESGKLVENYPTLFIGSVRVSTT